MKHFRPQQRPKKSTLIVGSTAIATAIDEGVAIDKILVQKDIYKDLFQKMRALGTKAAVPVQVVPAQKIASFNAGTHDGCIAVKSQVVYQQLQDIISTVVDRGEAPLLLMLDGVTDVRNIGGIARTAWCMGVHALIIPDKGVGALNEDAVLTSAGALQQLPVCRVSSLLKTVDDLHLHGIKVFGSQMAAKNRLNKILLAEPVCIILGSEEKGISAPLLKACDLHFQIPMHNHFESLNVSVAAAMILYEAALQRTAI